MRYLYVFLALLIFGLGGFSGYRLHRLPEAQPCPAAVATEVERTVIRTAKGRTETRVIERKTVKPETSQKPPVQYRLSALLPINDYQDVTVGAARRLGGNVWLESQYNIKRKEIMVGVSYEF